jgi:hypothetical protein
MKLLLVCVVLAILPGSAWADVTLSDLDAAKLTLKLEQGEMCTDLLATSNQVIDEQKAEIITCQDTVKALQDKNTAYAAAVKAKDDIIKNQGSECDTAIKAAKGTFWERLKGNVTVFTGGVVIGAVIAVVLALTL